MADTFNNDSVERLLKAQLALQGAALQMLSKSAGQPMPPLEMILVSLGLTQSEVGAILGKDRSSVSRAISGAKKVGR